MNTNVTNKKTHAGPLLSLLPALGYLILDMYFPVRVSVIGGLLLALVELAWEKWRHGEITKLSKFNLGLIVILSAVSFVEENGVWFKIAPALLSCGLGLVWLWKLRKSQVLYEMIREMNRPLPPIELWGNIEQKMAWAFFIYGVCMVPIAWYFSTAIWAMMKSIGAIFFLLPVMLWEMRRMRRQVKDIARTKF